MEKPRIHEKLRVLEIYFIFILFDVEEFAELTIWLFFKSEQ